MRKAVAALAVTAVAVVLLVRYDTHPPRTLNPRSALRPEATRAVADARPAASRARHEGRDRPADHDPVLRDPGAGDAHARRLTGVETRPADRRRAAHRGAQRAGGAAPARRGAGRSADVDVVRGDLHQRELARVAAQGDRRGAPLSGDLLGGVAVDDLVEPRRERRSGSSS